MSHVLIQLKPVPIYAVCLLSSISIHKLKPVPIPKPVNQHICRGLQTDVNCHQVCLPNTQTHPEAKLKGRDSCACCRAHLTSMYSTHLTKNESIAYGRPAQFYRYQTYGYAGHCRAARAVLQRSKGRAHFTPDRCSRTRAAFAGGRGGGHRDTD